MIVYALIAAAVFLSLWMALSWWVQKQTGKSGWIDTFWSYGTGIAGVSLALLVPVAGTAATTPRQWLVAALCAIWSARLGTHILFRTLGGSDDPRYAQLKKEWRKDAQRRLFWFLQIQALCGFVLALAVFVAAHNPLPGLRVLDWIGAALLAAAILGEGNADRQLKDFVADKRNKGKVAETGLWSYSRHPNYFFEWLGWFAYALIAFNASGNYWWWPLTLLAPAMMYWLLVHASGIPPLEEHMLRTRGAKFRAYQSRVNAFFPGPRHEPVKSKSKSKPKRKAKRR
jgi:steroid 5-alpha reductase family enzyme